MAAAKNKQAPKSEEVRKSPVYLPTSNPPKPHLAFLILMGVIAVVWFGLLAYLALQQVGTI
ncbi:hypothetical protein C5Y96_12655 [Blastopirellula marina]|uniref:Uncharacterized protein n=1 Tax=Blastopirellula marina TaxID=124 RepID=A0A2S8FGA8_9BACT|nr:MULTISPECIES: hypothetical protein [Pirellulaceae]PQO31192.1 hypothetical protein C5Y96_12655 [Blastopirellula marina]RCS51586.1 hypothetical protein DTL36_12665 [Bremerella cremea]